MTEAEQVRKLIFAVSTLVALTACGKSIDVAEWTEEVKLSDGTMVTVWRKRVPKVAGFRI